MGGQWATQIRVMLSCAAGAILVGWTSPPEQSSQPAPAREAPLRLDDDSVAALHEEAAAHYAAGRTEEALSAWVRILKSRPRDTAALYNSACAVTRLGFPDEAFKLLNLAVQFGFVNFEHLKRDPDLAALRSDPRYEELISSIERRYAEAAEHMERWSRETLGSGAIIERDESLRLVLATNLDRETFERMRKSIQEQVRLQIEMLFDGPPNSYVLVLVPTPEKADELIGSVYVGGYYDHDTRRLVLRDLGPSLRHEITHALHHGQMDRLGQSHPMWIQEGLASMFEMYDVGPEGRYRVLDNTRLNIVLNLRRAASLSKWRAFFAQEDDRFNRVRARAKYAEARAILQFLAEQGRLEEWYRLYLSTYREDRSGALALERLFGRSLDEVEREYRAWLGTKDRVAEKVRRDQPSLGLWVADQAANDGVQIVGVNLAGAAKQTGLRAGDVLTEIDGRPTYAVEELVADILRRRAGEEVTLRVRRGKAYREVKVILQPIRESRTTRDVEEPGVPV